MTVPLVAADGGGTAEIDDIDIAVLYLWKSLLTGSYADVYRALAPATDTDTDTGDQP